MFKKLFKKEEKIEKPAFDTDADLKAVLDFLKELGDQKKELIKHLQELKKLRHEHKVLTEEPAKEKNLRKQLSLYNRFIIKYRFFKEDTDVNAIRIKKIAQHYLNLAKKKKLKIYEKIKSNDNWIFDW